MIVMLIKRASALTVPFLLAFATFTVVFFLLSGCDAAGPEHTASSPSTIELTPAQQEVLGASGTGFGLELFRRLSAKKGSTENLLLSPLSVSTALTMTLNGARDSTLQALKQTLGTEDYSLREINEAHRCLVEALPRLDDATTLRSANSLWRQEGYPIRAAFTDTLRSVFDAETRAVDFAASGAADIVNDWVAGHTEGMIEKLVTDEDLDRSTELALLNALYFEAPWQKAFDPKETTEATFTRPDGSEAKVSMMRRTDSLQHFSTDRAKGIDLPYGNGAFRMTLVVPKTGESAQELAANLDQATWDRWLEGLEGRKVELGLPRFDITAPRANLNEVLMEMGLGVIFGQEADFSGLSPRDPSVEKVLHKAAVTVDEEGTEASAATGVTFGISARPVVRADRSFLFVIREAQTGTLVFLGRIADPTA